MNIKILVATHKKYWMPTDNVYLPIQVGAIKKEEDFGYLKDNTGYNISIKNPNYCELTALYWAWKNLKCDYIGLCHYRRYFAHKTRKHSLIEKKNAIYLRKDYENILKKYDIILVRPTIIKPNKENNYIKNGLDEYYLHHNKKDLDIVKSIIIKMYPDYINSFNKVMNNNIFYFGNMFVMRKSLSDSYCTWLFSILFEAEKYIDISSYDKYQSRVFGFLSERLFNVWLDKQNVKIFNSRMVFLEASNQSKKTSCLKNILTSIRNIFR